MRSKRSVEVVSHPGGTLMPIYQKNTQSPHTGSDSHDRRRCVGLNTGAICVSLPQGRGGLPGKPFFLRRK